MIFLSTTGLIEIIFSFKLALEKKAGRELPELSRFVFPETISANNFTGSDAWIIK